MIKLSTRGDYAIKTIIYLLKNNTSLVKISEISTNQKLSESLLRRVVADMERNSIIETIK
jgi:DNA-binding IscR family transcriptional regulator